MESNLARIVIEEEVGNYEDVLPFEDVYLVCSALAPIDKQYSYKWTLGGTILTTLKNTIEIRMPNENCGYLQALKVELNPLPSLKNHLPIQPTTQKAPVCETPLTALVNFTPLCKTLQVKSFYFYDNNTRKKLSAESIVPANYVIYIIVEVAGHNEQIIPNAYINISIGGELQKIPYIPLCPTKNRIKIPYFVPSTFDRKGEEVVVVEAMLLILREENIIKRTAVHVKYNASSIERVTCNPQPVVVGEHLIKESNYKPCKYTQIDVRYSKREDAPFKLFNESVTTVQSKSVYIIGKEKNLEFTLKSYNTKACVLEEHHDNKAILTLKQEAFTVLDPEQYGAQQTSDTQYLYPISKDGISKLGLAYQYPSLAKQFNFLIWNPPAQKGVYTLSTCRHTQHISLEVYPDIEWRLTIGLSQQKMGMSFTNMSNIYGRYKKYFDEAQSTGQNRELRKSNLKLDWSLTAKYDGTKLLKFAPALGASINRFFEAFAGVYEKMEELTGCNVVKTKASSIPLLKHTPFTLSFSSPSFCIYGRWTHDVSKTGNMITTGGLGAVLAPLIKAEGKIDVLACMETIPPYGEIIMFLRNTLELVNKGMDWLSGGKIQFEPDVQCFVIGYGEVNAVVELSLADDKKKVNITPQGRVGLGFSLSIKGDVKIKNIVLMGGDTNIDAGVGCTGKVDTSLSVALHGGWDAAKGCYLGGEITYPGIMMALAGEAYINSVRDKKKMNLNFSMEKSITFFKAESPLLKGTYYFLQE